MTGRSLWRTLSVTGRVVLVAGLLLLIVLTGHGLGLRWDPLNLEGRRLEAARNRAANAEAEAAAREIERESEAGQRQALDRFDRQMDAVTALTTSATLEARLDDDADLPLAPNHARRLRAHDRELCRLAPTVCAGSAAADPAGSGNDALRPDASD